MITIDAIETARELATHASNIQHLQEESIQKTLAEAHGGWRMLIGVGGAFALIGGAFGWFLEKLVK